MTSSGETPGEGDLASQSYQASEDDRPGQGDPPSGRFPDFYIVGHPKSGTTALYEMLKRHPQVFMPDLKEPRFFASDLRARFQAPGSDGGVPQTVEEYLALFTPAGPGQHVGEASPSYLRSRVAASAIAQARPDARIIAIFREPASFLRSLHLELVQNRVEDEKDLAKALAREDLAASPTVADDASGPAAVEDGGPFSDSAAPVPMVRYTDRVSYVEQLRRFHDVFPREQVLVLIYDDFRSDNEATVRKVLRFLKLDDTQPIEPVETNPTVSVRSLRVDDYVRSLYAGRNPVSRALKATIRTLVPEQARSDLFQAIRGRLVYSRPAPPDEDLMLELRGRFMGEVVALGEYLDRDLVSMWGYNGIE